MDMRVTELVYDVAVRHLVSLPVGRVGLDLSPCGMIQVSINYWHGMASACKV